MQSVKRDKDVKKKSERTEKVWKQLREKIGC